MVSSLPYNVGRPKSVILSTKRLSMTQLDERSRPWEWMGDEWINAMPCKTIPTTVMMIIVLFVKRRISGIYFRSEANKI